MVSLNWDHVPMTAARMLEIVRRVANNIEVEGKLVQFRYEQVPITLIYDEDADRMRLISPIRGVDEIETDQLKRALEANFHTALDARYCLSNDIVWAAFIHPLSELTADFFESAIRQVAVANLTFGSDYSSGILRFGG